MKRGTWAKLAVLASAIIVLGVTAWWLKRMSEERPSAFAPTFAQAVSRPSIDTVRYDPGAAQLEMIQSRRMTATPVPTTDPLSARIVYDEDVTARISVAVPGRVVAIRVSPGDSVKAGQVLAELDSPDFGAALADLDKARADERRKRLVSERARGLSPGQGIAAKDLELALADFAQARIETARADLRLRNLNPRGSPVNGQRVALSSPIDGIVTERATNPGLEVSPGSGPPLFVVSDLRRLWLMIDLPERLLGRVKLGSIVLVTIDAFPDERFTATVVQLGQVVDTQTRRVSVRAKLDNTESKLLPEMFVRASLLQDSGTGIEVPNASIVYRGIYYFVYVQTGVGEFQRRQVTLLTRGSEASFIGDGLKDGDEVVTAGAMLLDAELSAIAAGSR